MELLEVMLEETNKDSLELAQGLSEDLDVEILLQAMMQLSKVSSSILLCIMIDHYKIGSDKIFYRLINKMVLNNS